MSSHSKVTLTLMEIDIPRVILMIMWVVIGILFAIGVFEATLGTIAALICFSTMNVLLFR